MGWRSPDASITRQRTVSPTVAVSVSLLGHERPFTTPRTRWRGRKERATVSVHIPRTKMRSRGGVAASRGSTTMAPVSCASSPVRKAITRRVVVPQ